MLRRKSTLALLVFSVLVGQTACSNPGSSNAPAGSKSQPRFKPGFNLFSPQQDVQLGQQSAAQVMRETPMLSWPLNGSTWGKTALSAPVRFA